MLKYNQSYEVLLRRTSFYTLWINDCNSAIITIFKFIPLSSDKSLIKVEY